MLRKLFELAAAVSCLDALASASGGDQPIFIDTDLMTDVDDAGALAVASVLHNCGLADLRGVAINTQSKYGALAASVRRNPSKAHHRKSQHANHDSRY